MKTAALEQLARRQAAEEEPCADQLRSIKMILNSLDALVYVADMDTRELLFLNDYGKARWGEPQGRPCWQVLQVGQSGPCEFCTNEQLVDAEGQPTGVHVWEFQNSVDDRWYQCRDQAIYWTDGRLVRLEIAIDISERKHMEQELRQAVQRAERLASTDELTGLNNRRAIFELGAQVFKQAKRSGRPISIIMFDVDRFKQINDKYGHDIGDKTLRALAACVQPLLRAGDIVGRLGGEEFAVILPETDLAAASTVAERLRTAIAAMRLPTAIPAIQCTCSFGVATSTDGVLGLEALLRHADKALLRAKRAGRNRIEF